jgi:hypothetical protein
MGVKLGLAHYGNKLGLKVFENRELMRISTRMIKSITMRWPGRVARMGEMRNAYKILDGETEKGRPLGSSERKREVNIRTDLGEILWAVVD